MRRTLLRVLLVATSALAFAPPPGRHRASLRVYKNPFDEILDALDTMVGVSPLSEADLKDGDADLAARAEAKESVAPPEDALEKDSVAVFFALLGAFPIAIMIAGLAGGARPFGL